MTYLFTLRTIHLNIDILSASSDFTRPSLPESMRTYIKNTTLDLMYDLYDRALLDTSAFHDLSDKLSAAYVGGVDHV